MQVDAPGAADHGFQRALQLPVQADHPVFVDADDFGRLDAADLEDLTRNLAVQQIRRARNFKATSSHCVFLLNQLRGIWCLPTSHPIKSMCYYEGPISFISTP